MKVMALQVLSSRSSTLFGVTVVLLDCMQLPKIREKSAVELWVWFRWEIDVSGSSRIDKAAQTCVSSILVHRPLNIPCVTGVDTAKS